MSAASPAAPSTRLLWLTSADDGREHAVTDTEMEAGLLADGGIYRTVCGDDVFVSSMLTPPGPPCAECPTFDAYQEWRVAQRLAERKRRRRWWRRLARRVRRG